MEHSLQIGEDLEKEGIVMTTHGAVTPDRGRSRERRVTMTTHGTLTPDDKNTIPDR